MGTTQDVWLIGDTCVERTLFTYCKQIPSLSTDSLPCSNIIDPTDDDVQQLFTPEEWGEITSTIPVLPESDLRIIDGLDKVRTLEDLSQLVQAPPHSPDATPEQYWQFDICCKLYPSPPLVLFQFIKTSASYRLFSTGRIHPLKPHSEAWYSHEIWRTIIDCGFECADSLQASRGEIGSITSVRRRNEDRVDNARHRMGAYVKMAAPLRSDAIFHQRGPYLQEFGAMELSSMHSNQLDRKWDSDVRKTIHQMRNMLAMINRSTRRKRILKEVQTIGIVAAGLFCFPSSTTC